MKQVEKNKTKKQGKTIICSMCGKEKQHYAKGLCGNCYKAQLHRDKVGTVIKICSICGNRIYQTTNVSKNENKCSICRLAEGKTKNQDNKEKMLKKYKKLYKKYPEVVTSVTLRIWEDYLLGLTQAAVAQKNHTTRQNVNDIINRIKTKLKAKQKQDKVLHDIITQRNDIDKKDLEQVLLNVTAEDLKQIVKDIKETQKVG